MRALRCGDGEEGRSWVVKVVRFTEAEWANALAVLLFAAHGKPVDAERLMEVYEKIRDDAEDEEELE